MVGRDGGADLALVARRGFAGHAEPTRVGMIGEGGAASNGDRHVLVVQRERCVLYELYSAFPQPDGSWTAGSGAIFPLDSNALRPAGWTSALRRTGGIRPWPGARGRPAGPAPACPPDARPR